MAAISLPEPLRLVPLDALDTRVRDFGHVGFVNDGLQEFDAHLAAAAIHEKDAVAAFNDFPLFGNEIVKHIDNAHAWYLVVKHDRLGQQTPGLLSGKIAETNITANFSDTKSLAETPLTQLQDSQSGNALADVIADFKKFHITGGTLWGNLQILAADKKAAADKAAQTGATAPASAPPTPSVPPEELPPVESEG